MHGVPLSDTAKTRLDAGAPEVAFDELPGATGLEPGRPVRLVDRAAGTAAVGVADPENGVVRVFARADVRSFDAAFFTRRLETARALRQAVGVIAPDESYRLLNAEGDGLPGMTVDVYGEYAVVCVPGRGLLPYGRLLGEATLALTGLRGAVIKVRGRDPKERGGKEEVVGESPPPKLVVKELGVPYEVHLLGALNVGLFTDMREQRRGLARFVGGRRVLNTFAYTGALSVAAARAGASAVTSVDLSAGVLAWARENFRLSGFDPADARFAFEVSDTRRYLQRAQTDGLIFDTVMIDPPTVSAARASQWSMKKDYPELIGLAAKLLPREGGVLWLASNARKGGPGLLAHATEGLKRVARRGTVLEVAGQPPDYPTPASWPDARYLEICALFVLPDG